MGLAWLDFLVTPFASSHVPDLFSYLPGSSLMVALVISISMILFRKKLTRAVHYYLLITILVFTPLLTVFTAAFLRATNVYGKATWQFLIVAILVALQFGFLQFRSDTERLIASITHNTKSGRYTPLSGLWNVRRTLHWDNPQNEKQTFRRYERLSKLTYLIPGIGYLIARNSTLDERSLIFAALHYLWVLIIVSGIARHAAIFYHLLFLENKYSLKVTIIDKAPIGRTSPLSS